MSSLSPPAHRSSWGAGPCLRHLCILRVQAQEVSAESQRLLTPTPLGEPAPPRMDKPRHLGLPSCQGTNSDLTLEAQGTGCQGPEAGSPIPLIQPGTTLELQNDEQSAWGPLGDTQGLRMVALYQQA